MRASDEVIHQQGVFVSELAKRLADDVSKFTWKSYQNNHCQIQDDIKRLRRELIDLSKMFDYSI